MAQKIKEPAAKPEDPSLIPRTHMVEGENLPVTFTSVPKHMYTYTHTNKYVHTALVQSLVSYSTGQRDGGRLQAQESKTYLGSRYHKGQRLVHFHR